MFDDTLAAALGRAWADDRPWQVLSDLTQYDRMAGGPGERAAAETVADALDDIGCRDVTVDGFPMRAWRRGRTELAVTSPVERDFPAIALPYSPSGDVHAELVDVGHGTPAEIEAADLAGKVALAATDSPPESERFIHRMEKFGHAAAAGAEAFVFHNHLDGQLPPTGSLRFNQEAAVPGVGVSKETGAWLTEYAADGGELSLTVDAETRAGESHNVHGVLGPDTAEEIVVCAHIDAHDIAEGALDNGCGVATVVAAASVLSEIEDDLDCRVRVAGVGSEEVGLLGADALADELALDTVKAVVNVDGAGRARGLRVFPHGTDAFADLAAAVADAANRPVDVQENLHPYSDHWPFVRRGVPALQLYSATGSRDRGWGHTAADTRDKADARDIREHGLLAALLVRELSGRDVDRLDADGVRERLHDRDLKPGMEAAEIWPADWD
ncbi:M28 family metallopeptidase [Halocalculus aciditolerans]|uniref:Carboxypeptidase Q n=1 Tax=Halocalculus aciditolerans TaxID=1383812 RepID=A0A830FFF3_9EURY|nr:M28 family metallopeptidase [Halocalculus aciditolerans]GGL50055.1 hypothetical protein GCM10009039_05270 [Halocalculus aciditolerans]